MSACEQLTRVCAFLYVVRLPEIQTRALLADYTPEIHAEGVYYASVVRRERSFGEWHRWRALRPPRDPDLPELVSELDRFANGWQPRALSAAVRVVDAETARSSMTTSARPSSARAGRGAPRRASGASSTSPRRRYPPIRPWWAALIAEGIQTELARFHEVLKTVQDFIATAPIDADEIADIQAAREESAASVAAWLAARGASSRDISPRRR